MHEDIIMLPDNPQNKGRLHVQMVGISYCDGSYRIKRKSSEIHCFGYVIKGRGRVNCNDKSFVAQAGDVYVLQKGADHYYYSDDKNSWEKVWFNISGTLPDSLMSTYGIDTVNHIEKLDLSDSFFKFMQAARNNVDTAATHSRLEIMLHTIIQEMSVAANRRTAGLGQRIRSMIDDNIEGRLQLEQVAQAVSCTPCHAIRVFKSEYGQTPYEYLLGEKIRIARFLLKSSAMPVRKIAAKLAFCDEHYFSNVFKKRCGITPVRYRKGGEAKACTTKSPDK